MRVEQVERDDAGMRERRNTVSETEKAIQVYETEKECMNRTCSDCQGECLIESPAIPYGEALEIALGALREKAEREKGCEYCTNPEEVTGTQPTSIGTHEYFKLKSGFRLEHHYGREWVLRCEHCDSMLLFATHCPHCGRKLVP